ncbi:MAG TPA: sulfite reductase flavoprotein subunit alpha, partial [Rariglobus sp.]
MSSVPLIPDTAPFSAEQRAWLNGFLAGIFSRTPAPGPAPGMGEPPALTPLTILYGSQTGTAESLARQLSKEAGKRGFAPAILDMAQTDATRLAGEKNLLVITSTYGDGEPPDSARALHSALREGSHALSGVRYSVCALGDTNYTLFCQAGKDFDAYLEKHGATRIAPRTDCDVDYETPFTTWVDTTLAALGSASVAGPGPGQAAPALSATPHVPLAYDKKNPFPAPVLVVRNLNAPGSAKEVNHIEFDLTGSGLVYEAGDALGVFPHNCPQLVAEIISVLGCDGEEAVPSPAGELPLRTALTVHYDLGKPSPQLLELLGVAGSVGSPASVHHVLDALHASAVKPAPVAFAGALKKLQPRLYSISSSPKAHPGRVHLTVGAVRYELNGRPRKGVCSTFLAERALSHGTA